MKKKKSEEKFATFIEYISKKELFSSRFTFFRLLLEFILLIIIDISACLWIFEYIIKTKTFGYSCVLIIVVGLFCVLLIYFLSIRAVDIVEKDCEKLFLKKASIVVIIIVVILSVLFALMFVTGKINKSSLAHGFYKLSSTFLSKRYDLAVESLDEAIKYDTDSNISYYIERGDVYINIYNEKSESTKSEVRHIADDMYKLNAEDYLENAISDYSVALLVDPNNNEYKFKRGKAYALMGDAALDKALVDMESVYNSDSNNAKYMEEYGKILVKMKDKTYHAKGLDLIKTSAALRVDSTDKGRYYQRIFDSLYDIEKNEYKFNGIDNLLPIRIGDVVRINDAVSINDKGLHDSTEKMNSVMRLLSENKDFTRELIEGMKEDADKDKVDKDLLYEYCTGLQALGMYLEADTYIQKNIDNHPTFTLAYVQKGYNLNYLGDYDKAVDVFDKIIEVDNSAESHIYKADFLYNACKYDMAVNEYKIAEKKGTNKSAYCYYSIAQSYYRLNEYSNASIYYKKAFEEGLPKSFWAYCYKEWGDVCYILAGKSRDSGNETEAVDLYNKAASNYHNAIDNASNDTYKALCYNWAGNAYIAVNNYHDAIYNYNMAVQLDSSEQTYKDNLAFI